MKSKISMFSRNLEKKLNLATFLIICLDVSSNVKNKQI